MTAVEKAMQEIGAAASEDWALRRILSTTRGPEETVAALRTYIREANAQAIAGKLNELAEEISPNGSSTNAYANGVREWLRDKAVAINPYPALNREHLEKFRGWEPGDPVE